MKYTSFEAVPKFTRLAAYKVDYTFDSVPKLIERFTSQYDLEMNPDFQRPIVWDDERQIKYIEYLIRGGMTGKDFYFNCPGWMSDFKGPFQLIDGKQRFNAITRFLNNEIKVYDSYYSEYTDDRFLFGITLHIHINNLPTRAATLRWYLELNSMGVPHSQAEIKRVEKLLSKELSNG